jgi:hypothetical protein
MILRELFSTDNDSLGSTGSDQRYDGGRDFTAMGKKDTRKTRLTLRQINELRKASELHILEQEKELEFIEQMYKVPEQPAA